MTKLKRVVKARMWTTGESYTTALMRVRECTIDLNAPDAADESIRQSPPRLGKLLIQPRAHQGKGK